MAAGSVIVTPSMFHIVFDPSSPRAATTDCWPLSEPPTLTRSSCTPGTNWRSTHGSLAVGTSFSMARSKFATLPCCRVSSIGVSAVTFTSSCTPATVISIFSSTLVPTPTTTRSRTYGVKPAKAARRVYSPGSRFSNLNSPCVPVTVSRAPVCDDVSCTVVPGSTAPLLSVMVP